MSPEISTEWWGIIIAALVGLSGVIVGAVGLRQAKAARTDAQTANQIAATANEHAVEANQIAREANEISKSTEARSNEQHDVAWEWKFDPQRDGFVQIQNIGKSRALQARIQFLFRAANEVNTDPLIVNGGEDLRFEIEGLAEAIGAERKRRIPRPRTAGTIGGPQVRLPGSIPPPIPERFRLRVDWCTELGTPRSYDTGWELSPLPD